jgi:hypothetical protein
MSASLSLLWPPQNSKTQSASLDVAHLLTTAGVDAVVDTATRPGRTESQITDAIGMDDGLPVLIQIETERSVFK